MDFKLSLVLLALFVGSASCAAFERIAQLHKEGSDLVYVGPNNFAVSKVPSSKEDWKT